MTQVQAILSYQEADAKLYKLERDLASCDERKEYVKIKKFLESAPEKLDSLEAKAVALKAEPAQLEEKYAREEESLKDFSNLDDLIQEGADVSFYQKKVLSIVELMRKLKSDLNQLMENVKATDAEYQKLKKQVISAQKQFPDAQEKYKVVKASKEDERKAMEAEVKKLEKTVPAELLEKYQTKRKERIFPIVGELTGNRCPFCSMEPPLAARNQLTGGGTIECDNCRRIIFGK